MLRSPVALLVIAAAIPVASVAAQTTQAPRSYRVGEAVVTDAGEGKAASVQRAGGRFAVPATSGLLRLLAGTFDPLRDAPNFPGRLAAPAGTRLFAVQFATAIVPEYRAALVERGVEVLAYWPDSAYVVRGEPTAVALLLRQPWVRAVVPVAVAEKLPSPLQALVAAAADVAPVVPAEYDVVLATKSDRRTLIAAIGELGAEVTQPNEGSTCLRARLDVRQLAAVAALDTVLWIDAASAIERDMNNARIQGGANTVEFGAGLTGAGVRVQVLEGVEETHPDWTNVPIVQFDDNNDAHGHCTAMIIGGNGSGNTNARGLLPDGQVIEAAATMWGALSRYQVTAAARDPNGPYRALQQTASWGYATTTDYDAASQELDDVLFDFDLVATQSQSNTGTTSSRPQAWAKNVISVGGVVHHDNSNPLDDNWRVIGLTPASIGPASDGRIKPDVVAYYEAIQCGDLTGAAGYSATNYTTSFGGTSGATPIVAGYVGLIQQMFTDAMFGNALPLPATAANRFANRPHAATVKALLCNTSASYAFSGATADLTRTHQGWGFPDVARLWQNRDRLLCVDETDVLQQGEARTYYVWVRPGTAEFRATMSYADPPALPSAAVHRINSVDLQVVRHADGVAWWGNNGLDVGNQSQPGGVANDRDTLEQVWLQNPQPGIYGVTVAAPTIAQDAHVETPALDLDFGLAVHPMGGGYRAQTAMTLDLASAAFGDLRVLLSGVPTSGWTEGYTLVSFATGRPRGLGNLFGVERDPITDASMTAPLLLDDAIHFPNAGAGHFPFAPYVVPAFLARALQGVAIDAVTVLLSPTGQIVEMSNVDRVTVQ